MRRLLFLGLVILLLAMPACSNGDSPLPVNGENGDPFTGEPVYIDAFPLEKIISYRVAPKSLAGGSVETGPPTGFQATGKAFTNAVNNCLGDLKLHREGRDADIVIRMDNDEKHVSVKYGFYIEFSDGDTTSEYFLENPPQELIDAFNAIVQEAEEHYWEDLINP